MQTLHFRILQMQVDQKASNKHLNGLFPLVSE